MPPVALVRIPPSGSAGVFAGLTGPAGVAAGSHAGRPPVSYCGRCWLAISRRCSVGQSST